MQSKILKLFVSVGLCIGVGLLGSYFTISAIPTWYATLNKPSFSPPNWIFGPVWTILYFLMGVSLYLVLISKNKTKQKTINLFFLQLGLNALWSIIFFGLKSPILALVDIVALWTTILLTIKVFYPINRLASSLLIPYILWVSFASLLNLMIVILN